MHHRGNVALTAWFTTLTVASLGCEARCPPHEELVSLASGLSWASVSYGHRPVGPSGTAAEQLVALGKCSTPALVQLLRDPERGVAAHVILTAIWVPGGLGTTESALYRDNTPGSELLGFRYTVNGLQWTIRLDKQNRKPIYGVEANQLAENVSRWCATLPRRYREQCK